MPRQHISRTALCAAVRFPAICVLCGNCAVVTRLSPLSVSMTIAIFFVTKPYGRANYRGSIGHLGIFEFFNKRGLLHLVMKVRSDHAQCYGQNGKAKENKENIHEDELENKRK